MQRIPLARTKMWFSAKWDRFFPRKIGMIIIIIQQQ